LPGAVTVSELAVEAVKFTGLLSVTVTLAEPLVLNVPALVCTLMVPELEPTVKEGVDTGTAVAVTLPEPSADRVAEVLAVRPDPTTIDAPEPVAVARLTVLALSGPVVLRLPPAVSANVLPVDAPRFTAPLLFNVTFPEALALNEAALVWALMEPVVDMSVTVFEVTVPVVEILPVAVRAKVLPVELAMLTEPVSVNDTFPEVFALNAPALV